MQNPWVTSSCLLSVLSLMACDRDFSEDAKPHSSVANDNANDADSGQVGAPAQTGADGDAADASPRRPGDAASGQGSGEASGQGSGEDSGNPSGATSSEDSAVAPSQEAGPKGGSLDWSSAFDAVYDFEEDGLSIGKDSSGHGHHLQVEGDPEQNSDRAHGAFSVLFDNEGAQEGTQQGPLQYLLSTDEFVRTLDSPSVTVGAWVRTPLNTANYDYSVVTNGGEDNGGFSLRVRLDLKAVRCMIGANMKASYTDEILVADHREWNHIVCRYDSDSKQL